MRPTIKTLPLTGLKSLRAFNVFHTLLLGLKMLPLYIGETYDVFLTRFEQSAPEEQERQLRQACLFVELKPEEIEALTQFATDSNGMPFTSINTAKMNPADLIDIIVAVCLEIAKIKVYTINDTQKKS